MQTYDIIVLFLLIAATVRGARRGLAKQLASISSLVLGYIVAVNFREPVAQLIEAPHPWNLFAAMLGLFMVTSLSVWVGFRLVNGTVEKAGLKNFDAQMGGLFGMARGLVIVMVVTMFAVALLGDAQRSAVLGSFSGHNACRLLQYAQTIVPSEWQDLMRPYMEKIEQHQQLVEQVPGDVLPDLAAPDPFEMSSPSDASPPYDDTLFGRSTASPDSGDTNRYDDYWNRQPQATLQDPVLVR